VVRLAKALFESHNDTDSIYGRIELQDQAGLHKPFTTVGVSRLLNAFARCLHPIAEPRSARRAHQQ
jgi:hypothetical protein